MSEYSGKEEKKDELCKISFHFSYSKLPIVFVLGKFM